jgi:Rieske Fe-S protein
VLSPPRPLPRPASPARRKLLAGLTALLSAALASAAAVPVLGALLSPLLRRRARRTDLTFVAALVDLPVDVPTRVEIRSTAQDAWSRQDGVLLGAAWITRGKDDAVKAWSTVCPHLGCGVNHDGHSQFVCPCHDSKFDLGGAVRSGPSPRPLDPLEVEVKDRKVFVRYARFKQGQKQREEI